MLKWSVRFKCLDGAGYFTVLAIRILCEIESCRSKQP